MQGYSIVPILIGSEAVYVQEKDRVFPELTHEWKCYVKATPGVIKAVQFRLHESFKNPYINVNKEPFEILERGWGEFTIQIKITLFNDEKLNTNHYLRLHGTSYPVISNRTDTIVFKGDQIEINPEYEFEYEKDNEEYKRIDDAIGYMIDLLENNRR